MGVGDLLKLLKALDVILGRLAASAGTRRGNCICSLDERGKNGVGVDIAVMSLDRVDNNGLLAVAASEIGADNGVGTLYVMIDCLAEIVQQAGRASATRTSTPSSEAMIAQSSDTSIECCRTFCPNEVR